MRAAMVAVLCAAAGRADTAGDLVARVRDALAAKQPDAEVAALVRSAKLTERLDAAAVEPLDVGPLAFEELDRRVISTAKLPPAAPARIDGAPPPPSAGEQSRIVEHAREIALAYSAALPNFLCTETVRRYNAKKNSDDWQLGDTLEIDVAANGKLETYRLLTVNGVPTKKPLRSVGGVQSTGEFDSLPRFVFQEKSKTRFEWRRWTRLRGRLAHVFAIHIEQKDSEYLIDFRWFLARYRAVTAARGFVYLDAETHRLLRLVTEAEGIPSKWPITEVSSVLDYDFADVGGSPYLLPKRYSARVFANNGRHRNVTEFGNYRRFSAEATVSFEK
jgi:hypothetical protein